MSLQLTAPPDSTQQTCSLLSNHGLVLVCIARDPDSRLRDIAANVGITERAVFSIVADLERSNVIERTRIGRRNRYTVLESTGLGHMLVHDTTVGQLLPLVAAPSMTIG